MVGCRVRLIVTTIGCAAFAVSIPLLAAPAQRSAAESKQRSPYLAAIDLYRRGYSLDAVGAVDALGEPSTHIFLRRPDLVPTEFLPTLAAETGVELIDAENEGEVEALCVRVTNEIRSSYVLTYIPAGVASGGWHAIPVSLRNARGVVTARRGYQRSVSD